MRRLIMVVLLMAAGLLPWAVAVAHAQVLVASDDGYGVSFDQPPILEVEAPGVLDNDTLSGESAEENGVTVQTLPVNDVSHGTLDLNADGSFSYTPDAGFNGSDSFVYRAVSGALTSEAHVTLTACTGGPDLFSCWQESSYLEKLAALGYSTFQDGFEDDDAWGSVRSPNSAPEATSLGITWTSNYPTTNEITTGGGPARTGQWGVYDPDHGFATGTALQCDIDNPPAECLYHDGFSGKRIVGQSTLHAVGGYITGTAGANIAIILDGTLQTTIGKLPDPDFYFFGVIDASAVGFNRFEFRELDGKVGQSRYIFGDDFTFATKAVSTNFHVSALNGSDTVGDGSVLDPWQTINHALSQIDGSIAPATILITDDTYMENVIADKAGGLYHLVGGCSENFLTCTTGSDIKGSLSITRASVSVRNILIK